MKFLQLILFLLLSSFLMAQNDTVFYIGVNGKTGQVKNKEYKKEITYRSKKRMNVSTYKMKEGNWQSMFTEKITVSEPSVYNITIKSDVFSREKITRTFEPQNDSVFKFTDRRNGQIKRTGYTLSKIPLLFHGEVTEYYDNGNKKSVSKYNQNELVSNKNWKRNGEEYIHNVFYSVDIEPRFTPGMPYLHEHILKVFDESGINISEVEGRLVVGFVVMENGEIEGIRIEKGINLALNNMALQAFYTLPEKWVPAKLNQEYVRYYQLFPINFIYKEYDFDLLELKGSMLYWEIN